MIESLMMISIFKNLSPVHYEALRQKTRVKNIAQKQPIFYEGEERQYVYFIIEGMVKTIKFSITGDEKIVGLFKRGDMITHAGLLDKPEYAVTAQALTTCRIAAIPLSFFKQFLMTHSEVALEIINLLSTRVDELQQKMLVHAASDVQQRMLHLLIYLSDQLGCLKDGSILIELPMTHYELANMISITRETLNRFLNMLRKNQVIDTTRGKIKILKPSLLRDMLKQAI